jgi:hypothetical protein
MKSLEDLIGFEFAFASEDRQDLIRMPMTRGRNSNSATVFKRPNGNWQYRKMTADKYWRYYLLKCREVDGRSPFWVKNRGSTRPCRRPAYPSKQTSGSPGGFAR